ncbi:hypothetical protein [Vibrio mangrovi]|uniref:Uncharacterized protein n=1 Tax=Vibrio mangrovi TaxID=474394 RepID=A0ABU4I1Q0_9VIBR|nr:hypothetical protein [Vibrio mangrovi]MDW6001865.1 hypothetical protein [Vibrio mangrovi]
MSINQIAFLTEGLGGNRFFDGDDDGETNDYRWKCNNRDLGGNPVVFIDFT